MKKIIPIETIINGILLEGMSKEAFFDSNIKDYIQELKRMNRIDLNQRKELEAFFLILQELGNGIQFTKEDFEFFTRKLFSLYEIPNTEKIRLIYQGIKFHIFDEASARDILRDYNLVSFHNELIIEFEKTLK